VSAQNGISSRQGAARTAKRARKPDPFRRSPCRTGRLIDPDARQKSSVRQQKNRTRRCGQWVVAFIVCRTVADREMLAPQGHPGHLPGLPAASSAFCLVPVDRCLKIDKRTLTFGGPSVSRGQGSFVIWRNHAARLNRAARRCPRACQWPGSRRRARCAGPCPTAPCPSRSPRTR